jgi:hypothetical protein
MMARALCLVAQVVGLVLPVVVSASVPVETSIFVVGKCACTLVYSDALAARSYRTGDDVHLILGGLLSVREGLRMARYALWVT